MTGRERSLARSTFACEGSRVKPAASSAFLAAASGGPLALRQGSDEISVGRPDAKEVGVENPAEENDRPPDIIEITKLARFSASTF